MAGIASGAELAESFDVVVLEQEFQTGYHSTGRSAAVLHLAFENDVVHRLSLLSEAFYVDPPEDFGQIAEPLEHIAFDTLEHRSTTEGFLNAWMNRCPWLQPLSETELRDKAPLLNSKQVCGSLDDRSLRLDVNAILQGFTRRLRERGGRVIPSHRVSEIERTANGWHVATKSGEVQEGDILVNAAGAWADSIARLAAISPIGIQPRRRTGVMIDLGDRFRSHPMCYRASGGLYFKPEGAHFMVSPADATDAIPSDVQPDELDVAITLDTFNQCTNYPVERPVSSWAGLRSFATDDVPVIGFDPHDSQFFWVAGLGGFGIQTAPAYARMVADLMQGKTGPELELVEESEVSPVRFKLGT